MTGNCRCSGHRRADQMCAAARALTALEVAIRGRSTAFPCPESIIVHAEAHRAAGLAPFEAGRGENAVEPLTLGLCLHQSRAGYDQDLPDVVGLAPTLDDGGGDAQIFDARVGTGSDEHLVDPN